MYLDLDDNEGAQNGNFNTRMQLASSQGGSVGIDFTRGDFEIDDFYARLEVERNKSHLTISSRSVNTGLGLNFKRIIHLGEPTSPTDAVTKEYVDDQFDNEFFKIHQTNDNTVIEIASHEDGSPTLDLTSGNYDSEGYHTRLQSHTDLQYLQILTKHSNIALGAGGKRLIWVKDPEHDQDAATKLYVDQSLTFTKSTDDTYSEISDTCKLIINFTYSGSNLVSMQGFFDGEDNVLRLVGINHTTGYQLTPKVFTLTGNNPEDLFNWAGDIITCKITTDSKLEISSSSGTIRMTSLTLHK